MSEAIGTQGFKFEIGSLDSPPVFTEVEEVVSFKGFDGQASTIDVTHLRSTAKEFIMGLQEAGSFSIDVNHIPDADGQAALRAAKAAGVSHPFKCTFSDTSTALFRGFVLSNPISGAVDAKVDGTFNIQITGAITFS